MVSDFCQGATDDPAFLGMVEGVVDAVVRTDEPAEVYVVHTDNWFNHRWLRYSGLGRVGFFGSLKVDTALDPIWRDRLTFPPFTPNRVLAEHYFRRSPRGGYAPRPAPRVVHRWWRRGHSAWNLQRRVRDFARSAAFFWLSSNTAANRRGSLMTYTSRDGAVAAWYASFHLDAAWRLGLAKGTPRPRVEALLRDTAGTSHC
jgi:hypothetical protein